MKWFNFTTHIVIFALNLNTVIYAADFIQFYDLNNHKVESVGSILLVEEQGELYFLLGKLNMAIEEGIPTYNLFYGDKIREASYPEYAQFSDETALEASKRVLAWHFIGLTGDPRLYDIPAGDKVDDTRREAAYH